MDKNQLLLYWSKYMTYVENREIESIEIDSNYDLKYSPVSCIYYRNADGVNKKFTEAEAKKNKKSWTLYEWWIICHKTIPPWCIAYAPYGHNKYKNDEDDIFDMQYWVLWQNVTTLKAFDWMKDIKKFDKEYKFNTENEALEKTITDKEYCYLIRLMNEVNLNLPIYKIGKTKNILKRMKSAEYRNAEIFCIMGVNDMDQCEIDIIQRFTEKFKLVNKSNKTNFGDEYFDLRTDKEKYDLKNMINEFISICSRYI